LRSSDLRWWSTSPPEPTEDLLGDQVWVLVLPDSDHGPARGCEGRVVPPVPVFVASKLCSPVEAISLRTGAMVGTSVPEAAVDENRELGSREDDVGADSSMLSRNMDWIINSKAKTQGKEGGTNSSLGLSVTPTIALHRGAHRRAGSLRRSRQPFDFLNLAGATNGATCPTDSSRSSRSVS
jgi:hypothetical protein